MRGSRGREERDEREERMARLPECGEAMPVEGGYRGREWPPRGLALALAFAWGRYT